MQRIYAAAFAVAITFLVTDLQAQTVDPSTKEELKKTDSVPPATAPRPSEQAGTTEPSSKVESSKDENVFRNGVLAVPGATVDVDTAPAKFSARSAADDRLPTIGYRMKLLSAEQSREIAERLSSSTRWAVDGHAVVGREVPSQVAAQAIAAVPAELSAKFAELRGTGFMKSDGKIVIVDLDNNLVVGVLGG